VPRTRMLELAELPPDLRAEAEKWQALGGDVNMYRVFALNILSASLRPSACSHASPGGRVAAADAVSNASNYPSGTDRPGQAVLNCRS
jgi:hypothetical protein